MEHINNNNNNDIATTGSSSFLLWLCASAESGSEHPLALAVMEAYKNVANREPLASLTQFATIPGEGLQCTLSTGQSVAVGNERLMTRLNVPIRSDTLREVHGHSESGCTVVFVSNNNLLVGYLAIADQLRPEAASVVAYLKKQGIEPWMVTGDNERTAMAIAQRCGIEKVFAQVLPAEKQLKVQELQRSGRTVCFVGDGVNDSPALMQADVGMAIGAGTDVAIESADMVLMKDNLRDVIVALTVASSTFNRIRLNFFWAFLYNCIGIPLAAGVIYPLIAPLVVPPAIAGLAMALSSVTVVLSSLALKLWRPPKIDNVDSVTLASSDQLVGDVDESTVDEETGLLK